MNGCELNTLPLGSYAEQVFSCICGRTHAISTKNIVFGKNTSNNLGYIIENLLPVGSAIFWISDECSESFLKACMRKTSKKGFRLGHFAVEDDSLISHLFELGAFDANKKSGDSLATLLSVSEDTRLVVAAGGKNAVELSKLLCLELDLPLVVLAASPSYSLYLAPFVCAGKNLPSVLHCVSPIALVADTDWLYCLDADHASKTNADNVEQSPTPAAISICFTNEREITAAFGEIVSKLIAIFDCEMASCVDGKQTCPFVLEQALALVDACIDRFDSGYITPVERAAFLLEHNIRFSALLQLDTGIELLGGSESLASTCLDLLLQAEQRHLRPSGENRLIFASVLAKVYSRTLEKMDKIAFVPPPDNNLRAETFEHYLGVPEHELLPRLKPISHDRYIIEEHKLREYRQDLLALVRVCDKKLTRAMRIFRRLFNDGGYSLSHYIDHTDLRLCIALAPDVHANSSFLSKMKNKGLLDLFL